MTPRLPCLPALALSAFTALALGVASPAHADGDEAHSELFRLTEPGLGLVTKGVGLATRSESIKESGQIAIAGIPAGASIVSAHLYWALFSLAPDGAMRFQGTQVDAQHIGTSANTCWNNWSAASVNHVYRADVTAQVPGNGIYTVSGFPSGPASIDTQGASLVVLYHDPNDPRVGTVILHDGAITVRNSDRSDTFADVEAPALEAAWLHVGVGDGQAALTDGQFTFRVRNRALNLEDGANGPFRNRDGAYWDDIRFSVIPDLNNAGAVSPWWRMSGGDCLVFTYTALTMTQPHAAGGVIFEDGFE